MDDASSLGRVGEVCGCWPNRVRCEMVLSEWEPWLLIGCGGWLGLRVLASVVAHGFLFSLPFSLSLPKVLLSCSSSLHRSFADYLACLLALVSGSLPITTASLPEPYVVQYI